MPTALLESIYTSAAHAKRTRAVVPGTVPLDVAFLPAKTVYAVWNRSAVKSRGMRNVFLWWLAPAKVRARAQKITHVANRMEYRDVTTVILKHVFVI